MSEGKGVYELQKHDAGDRPADDGVPFWTRPAISNARWLRVQALGLRLVPVILATRKGAKIRAAAQELMRLLEGA